MSDSGLSSEQRDVFERAQEFLAKLPRADERRTPVAPVPEPAPEVPPPRGGPGRPALPPEKKKGGKGKGGKDGKPHAKQDGPGKGSKQDPAEAARPNFWQLTEDYFRDVDSEDLELCLRIDPAHDPAYLIPAPGRHYSSVWIQEDAGGFEDPISPLSFRFRRGGTALTPEDTSDRSGRSFDSGAVDGLLETCQEHELALLVKQASILRGMSTADVAAEAGVGEHELDIWMKDHSGANLLLSPSSTTVAAPLAHWLRSLSNGTPTLPTLFTLPAPAQPPANDTAPPAPSTSQPAEPSAAPSAATPLPAPPSGGAADPSTDLPAAPTSAAPASELASTPAPTAAGAPTPTPSGPPLDLRALTADKLPSADRDVALPLSAIPTPPSVTAVTPIEEPMCASAPGSEGGAATGSTAGPTQLVAEPMEVVAHLPNGEAEKDGSRGPQGVATAVESREGGGLEASAAAALVKQVPSEPAATGAQARDIPQPARRPVPSGRHVSRGPKFVESPETRLDEFRHPYTQWLLDDLMQPSSSGVPPSEDPAQQDAIKAETADAEARASAAGTAAASGKLKEGGEGAAPTPARGRPPAKLYPHEEYLPPEEALERLHAEDALSLLAVAPDDEVVGELLMAQGELRRLSALNTARFRTLLERMLPTLPAQMEKAAVRNRELSQVAAYVEKTREARRMMKRERREREQAAHAAAAAAAAANSTRQSNRREGKDGSKTVPHDGPPGARRREDDHDEAHSDISPLSKDALTPGTGDRHAGSDGDMVGREESEGHIPPGRRHLDNDTSSEDTRELLIDDLVAAGPSEDEAVCVVCGNGDSEFPNQIVYCERCRLWVHQKCYGIKEIPDGEWYCWVCTAQLEEEVGSGAVPPSIDDVKCALCPVRRGAFKKTDDDRWVHLVCALWSPEMTVQEIDAEYAVEGLEAVSNDRWSLLCQVCHRMQGACIQCNYGHCQASFHPLCARRNGYFITQREVSMGKMQYRAYCDKHSDLQRERHLARAAQLAQQRPPAPAPLPPPSPSVPKASTPKSQASGLQVSIPTGRAARSPSVTPTPNKGGRPPNPPPVPVSDIDKMRGMRKDFEKVKELCEAMIKRERHKASLAAISCQKAKLQCSQKRDARGAAAGANVDGSPVVEGRGGRGGGGTTPRGEGTRGEGARGAGRGAGRGDSESSGGARADSHAGTPEAAGPGRAKRPKLTIDPPRSTEKMDKVKVDRECVMTTGEAEVTNQRLPNGYMYVPLDAFSSPNS